MRRFLSEPPQMLVHDHQVRELNDLIIGMKLIAEADSGYDAWSRHEFAMGFASIARHIRKCFRHGRSAERFESVSDMMDVHKQSADYLDKVAKAFEIGRAIIGGEMIAHCERICREIEGCTDSMIKY